MDLHLLLTGKAMGSCDKMGSVGEDGEKHATTKEKKKMMKRKEKSTPTFMEFIGVHAKAVKWTEEKDEKDELEEVGRKLFAKYDGGVSGEE